MKINQLTHFFNLSTLLITGVLLFGCDKEEDTDEYLEEAADVVAATYGDDSSSQGITGQASELVSFAKDADNGLMKIQDFDTSITKANSISGALGLYTWNYVFNFKYGFSGLNTMNFSYSMNGTYEIPSMSSADSANANWTVTGISALASELVVNGSYFRDGSQQSKVRRKLGLTTNIDVSLADMKINKTTKQVTSGSSSFSIEGNVSDGRSFNYNGTVVFNGDRTATLTMKDQTWTINLNTGKIK